MRALGIVALLCLGVSSAAAQPAGAVGKPLPSPDLPDGTVTVRVVDGDPAAPRVNIEVTLVVDGKRLRAKTNDLGRAQFEHVVAGATAIASVATRDPLGTSEQFTVPASGGIRVVLSTRPWRRPGRKTSGVGIPVEALPAGSLEVQLSYDELADPRPPAGVTVSLIGYASDDVVSMVQRRTDATGVARFTDLDATGAVAYYALAQLPRRGRADRLISRPVLPDSVGQRVVLSAELRSATTAPIDDLAGLEGRAPTAVPPRGKLRVNLAGWNLPRVELTVRDAASGKILVHRMASNEQEVVDVPGKPGAIVHVDAQASGRLHRSLPVELVGDRGAEVSIRLTHFVDPTYDFVLIADDDAVIVRARLTVANQSWLPYTTVAGQLPRFPLPRGATRIERAADTRLLAMVIGGELVLDRPLPPGDQVLAATFDLPAIKGSVAWSLDLPHGSRNSALWLEQERGFTIEEPSYGNEPVTTNRDGTPHLVIDGINVAPGQRVTATIHLPTPGPDTALLHACRRLVPDATPMVGQSIDATLAQLVGGSLTLSSMRGKPVLVNVMATWDHLSRTERPKLAELAKRLPGFAIVMVASDSDPSQVATTVGKLPFPVLLDPPTDAASIGAATSGWGVKALPESLLVDRTGIVRYHFQNARDWDSADALRCVKAFAAAP